VELIEQDGTRSFSNGREDFMLFRKCSEETAYGSIYQDKVRKSVAMEDKAHIVAGL
jgi:hypothetical protein